MLRAAVLFARRDSVYKEIDGLDVFDIDRDARTWRGGCPVVAHPPCRAWGRLRNHAKPRDDERETGVWAVDQVRLWGGVLEHPAKSSLWLYAGLPAPGHYDEFGGHTLPIEQSWWGHRCEKKTWLYVVGCRKSDVPSMPLYLGRPERVVCCRSGYRSGMPGWRPEIGKAERERTPEALAHWLVDLAAGCAGNEWLRAAA